MRTVIGLFGSADQAQKALEAFVEFGAVREQITLLARQDDQSDFDRAIKDYNVRTDGLGDGDERALLVITVNSTFDADHARDMMLTYKALTVATRSKVWPHKRSVNLV